MLKDKQYLFYVGAAFFGLFCTSYMSSVLYYLMAGYGFASAMPWSIFTFLPQFHEPAIQSRLFVSIGAPFMLVIFALSKLSARQEPEFGDAHWATAREIESAGLFKKHGVLLGKYKGRYLVSDSPTHVLCVAPTRSGKGVGIVTPNLLNWPDSLICLDIKQENFKNTAGYRKAHGHDVFMWSPIDRDSHRYNPLEAISPDPYQRISDIQVIANILIKDPPNSDPTWTSEARALFIGLALYVIGNPDMPSTIGAISRLLGTEQDLGDILRHIVQTIPELSSTIKKSLMNFANKAAKERSGVKTSVNQAINLWDNPVVDAATSCSDFTLAELRKKKMAIYVGVRTGQIQALSPLLRIFFEQVITILSMKEPDETEPYKVLLIMDEFHMLGEMSPMTSAFTLLGGYNCRVMAIVQGLKWIDDVYGRDKRDGILSCCAHQIFFAANDLETAAYVSNSCGEKTIQTISTSQKSAMKYDPPNKNTSSRARPLISREKVKQLPKHEEIIITEASFPVRARKIQYFSDKNFQDRVMSAPEIPKLEVIDQMIPEFDIPVQSEGKKNQDPNQLNIFQPAETARKPLTSWLDDAAALRAENAETDEAALILKILGSNSGIDTD